MYLDLPNSLFRYQSTVLGSYQTVELIETFMNYQVLFFFVKESCLPCHYNILDLVCSYVMLFIQLEIYMYSMATLVYDRYIGMCKS
jgi:hypothetical protein